jgi:hypothetical protein
MNAREMKNGIPSIGHYRQDVEAFFWMASFGVAPVPPNDSSLTILTRNP